MTHSYESTNVIDPSEQNAFPQTTAEEASMVDETERQATPTSPSTLPANRGADVLETAEKREQHSFDNKSSSNSAVLRRQRGP